MNILRRVAQNAVNVNAHACQLMLKVYGRLSIHFFKKVGFSGVVAQELAVGMTAACKITIEEQHQLVACWLRGEMSFEAFEKKYEERQLEHIQQMAAVFDRVLCPSA